MHGGLARFKSELLQCYHSDLKRACGVKGGGGAGGKVIEAVVEAARACLKRKKTSHRRGASRVMDPPPPHVLTFDEQLKGTTL